MQEIKINFGKMQEIKINFGNDKIFETYCKLVIIRNGGILNENDAHCRVSDERYRLRINASIPPRNVSGPALSIRKHREKSYTLSDLKSLGMINEEISDYLEKVAKTNMSILIAGKGGSGKTTIERTIINIMPVMERVLIAESDSELYPEKPNCIVQKVKKVNEGGRPVTLYELINDGLTMSLDTYVIGEIVGREAYPFINAGFTGHRVMGSLHTWSPEDVMPRLLAMAKAGGATESEKTLKELIGRAIDLVIYMDSYKVTDIIEVLGYNSRSDTYETNRLFEFKKSASGGVNGELTGEYRRVNPSRSEKTLGIV
jgi:pilus assembly protein CpaF